MVSCSNSFSTKGRYTCNLIFRLALNLLYVATFFSSVYIDSIFFSQNAHVILVIGKLYPLWYPLMSHALQCYWILFFIKTIGNNMNMYLGSFLIFFGLLITWDLSRYNSIFIRLASIDKDFNDLFGSTVQIRDIANIQYKFEVICIAVLSAAFLGISIYDLNIVYPP